MKKHLQFKEYMGKRYVSINERKFRPVDELSDEEREHHGIFKSGASFKSYSDIFETLNEKGEKMI